jgi:hypothetical protein
MSFIFLKQIKILSPFIDLLLTIMPLLNITPNHFVIKDLDTKKPLLRGRCEGGLYPLKSSLPSNKRTLSATKPSTSRWHSHLGHPSSAIVHQVLSQGHIPFILEKNKELYVMLAKKARVINYPILDLQACPQVL